MIDVQSGVPQRSDLGPTLFLIFINDLPEFSHTEAKLHVFADDTKTYTNLNSPDESMKLQLITEISVTGQNSGYGL